MALEFYTEAPNWQKAVIWIIPIVAIGFLGYYFLLSPKMAEVAQLRQEVADLERKVAQGRAEARSLASYEAKAKELEARLAAARERLPAEKEIPGLYRQIHSLASQQGLEVSLFQPRPVQLRDYYAEVPITLTADADYHELGNFFEKLARLPRIVTLATFKLTGIAGAAGGPAKGPATGNVRVELNLVTYLAPEAAPGAKK